MPADDVKVSIVDSAVPDRYDVHVGPRSRPATAHVERRFEDLLLGWLVADDFGDQEVGRSGPGRR